MQNYYQSYSNYFWFWEDNYQLVEVPLGGTIAYKAYLDQLLKELEVQGIPPFGSLLLAIAATNPNAKDNLELIEDAAYQQITSWGNTKRVEQEHLHILYDAIDFLNELMDLPEQYKQKEGRKILFQMLFEEHQYLNKKLNSSTFTDPSKLEEKTAYAAVFLQDFKHFAKLVEEMPEMEDILEKLQELPVLEEELEIPEEEDQSNAEEKDFLEELMEDPTTFPIASLIRPIWAGLKIPINNALPSHQRLGGVSDISNKGEFDQLLISEFANEDLIFMSRLANREALFIQREQPPVSDAFQRVILVDISIFNWGTPKLINYAIALAIAEHPRAKEDCEIYLLGATAIPVQLKTADALIESLQLVDVALSPAEGIQNFFEEYASASKMEVFLISHEESLKEKVLQTVLRDYRSKIQYSFVTNDEGTIQFFKHLKSGKRHLQKLSLNLEKLWANPPKKKEKIEGKLPKFDSPLLYPIPTNIKKVVLAADGAVFINTGDGKLVQNYSKSTRIKGCIEIMDGVKENYAICIGMNAEGQYLFFRMDPQNRSILIRNLSTGVEREGFFHAWMPSAYENFHYRDGAFHYYHPNRYWSISMAKYGGIQIRQRNQMPKGWKEEYQKHQQKTQGVRQSFVYKSSVLKNIYQVYINEQGNLMLNTHELACNAYGVFKLDHSSNQKSLVRAEKQEDSFEFPDGSRIQINRLGMMLLRSANINIPTIYIPTVLDAALGLATDTEFAGYDYYQNPDLGLQKISTEDFKRKYLNAFLEHVIEY
jgi:hypothetical protein